MTRAALLPRTLTFLAYVTLGVAGGQIAGWALGTLLTFANITNIIGSVFGDDAASWALFIAASATYAAIVAICTAAGLGALGGSDDVEGAEMLCGLLSAVAAFALVTFLAEQYAGLMAAAIPLGLATWLVEQTGVFEFVAAVVSQAVPIAVVAVLSYGIATAWGAGHRASAS